MADLVKQILARPIQLADKVTKAGKGVNCNRTECLEIKLKTEKLAALLRQAARASNDLYERPTRRIIDDTEQVLHEALGLVFKCRANGLKRLFTIIPQAAFRKTSQQLENSIIDVSWLLRVSTLAAGDRDDDYLGLPPIAANEPILCLIWEQIAQLCSGSLDERSDAAASLVSLARDNDRHVKLIVEEGGVAPLLKLAKEGRMEGQENAARAIGLLGRDPESVEHIVNAGACKVFAKILKEGPLMVQVVAAWAISELAANHKKCQDHFAQNNTIRLLVTHLAFETIQEHGKYAIVSKQEMSIHTVLMANSNNTNTKTNRHQSEQLSKLPQSNAKTGNDDPATKARMKAMASKALWHLCAGNASVCRILAESRALLCFAVLLEKGHDEVQYNSAMALMEIATVAEQNAELRRSAFKPTSPSCKAVVDQFFKIIQHQQPNSVLLIPCIRAIGHLARTFKATERRIIPHLVRLLEDTEAEISREALITLTKFAETENFLHKDHCKAIVDEGGPKQLIQLVYFGEQMVQPLALILLGYIALHVPDNEAFGQAEVLRVVQWASKQGHLRQDPLIETRLIDAKNRLELYQSIQC